MNRSTAFCIVLVLLAGTGILAHAQPVTTLDTRPARAQPVMGPAIYCARQAAPSTLPQACEIRQPYAVTHPGSIVTHLEIECVLSGKCEVAERNRIHY
jgi:hypothetical protein